MLWEAQFGDFANGAQVIIDQFITSGESKWGRASGLVLLLPHGYEGQGPEHSSARLERFLQMCAGENIQVVNCTTPANYFHALRRQMHRAFRKPLIVMTPKSLLRNKRCVSSIDDFTKKNSFHRVLEDHAYIKGSKTIDLTKDKKIEKVVMCSGKIYFDLLEAREKSKNNRLTIVRIEQLYPFPAKTLAKILKRYENAEFIWCQEEPKNMGAWNTVRNYIDRTLQIIEFKKSKVKYIGRNASSTTATGNYNKHLAEQKNIRKGGRETKLMSEKIIVPTLGESVTEATVAKWLKNKGDKVSSDEPLVELETDKVNVEVPSPSNGILDNISAKEGDTVNVGAMLGSISQIKSASISSKSDSNEKKYAPPKLEKIVTEKTIHKSKKTKKENKELAKQTSKEEIIPKVFNEEPLLLEEEPLILNEVHDEIKETNSNELRVSPAARKIASEKKLIFKL